MPKVEDFVLDHSIKFEGPSLLSQTAVSTYMIIAVLEIVLHLSYGSYRHLPCLIAILQSDRHPALHSLINIQVQLDKIPRRTSGPDHLLIRFRLLDVAQVIVHFLRFYQVNT
jgi:hypothetical protein